MSQALDLTNSDGESRDSSPMTIARSEDRPSSPGFQLIGAPDRMAAATVADLEAMRLLLSGGSVIDWHQLAFEDMGEVRRFLRINEFDLDDPVDVERLEELRSEAVEYLTRHLGYRIPEEVAEAVPAHELLLLASRRGRHQTYACIVLKVMHVLHHLDGRETLFQLPVSDNQLFSLVEAKVVRIVDELRSSGLPIVEFAWSRKERDSLITKLLAKKETIAAHVYDKMRFRLITRRLDDIAPVLRELLGKLIPWNYVIPGQTVNTLLPFSRLFEQTPTLNAQRAELQNDADLNLTPPPPNQFSAPGFKVINFIADLPVRVRSILEKLNGKLPAEQSIDPHAVLFVLTEFQVMDQQTHSLNEQGEGSHQAYKERQQIEVKARLTRSMRSRSNGK